MSDPGSPERPLDRLLDLELELPERGTGARAARRAARRRPDRSDASRTPEPGGKPEPGPVGPPPPVAPSGTGPSRRWLTGFAALLTLAVVAGAALTYLGVDTVRDSTAGRTVSTRLEPHEPGFEGFLEPTPTLLVVHEVDGELDSMALLGLGSGDAGGSVLLIPPATVLESSVYEGPASVAYAFGDGVESVFGQVERLLGIGIAAHVVVDDDRWSELTAGVAPIAIDNPDEVGGFEAGPIGLAGPEVGAFLSARDEGESDLGRLFRHELFWDAWLDQVAASGDPSAVPGELDSGIGRFVRGLAAGRHEIATLPVVEEVDENDNTQFRIDPEPARELVSRFIPFPRGAEEGARTRVRLLDGTGEPDHAIDVAPRITPAGAAIVVVGNAEAFDHEETEIRYHEPSQREAAERLRDALGTGRVIDDARQTDAFDVTIVLGTDI